MENNDTIHFKDIEKEQNPQRIFSLKNTGISFLVSIIIFGVALWRRTDFWIFFFVICLVYSLISLAIILPDILFNWFRDKKQTNYYTWSRLRANTSVTDFTMYFFNKTNTFNEEKIENNFDRDKQILDHLKKYTEEELKIGLALLTNSKIENPIISFLTTSTVLTVIYQQRYFLFELLQQIFAVGELPDFISIVLLLEIAIIVILKVFDVITNWNHRSYLIKMSEIALDSKQ